MYLTCVAVYHAVDRVAPPGKSGNVAVQWRSNSPNFYLVDIVAHHFKHVKADDERPNSKHPGIPIGHALGFDRVLGLEHGTCTSSFGMPSNSYTNSASERTQK